MALQKPSIDKIAPTNLSYARMLDGMKPVKAYISEGSATHQELVTTHESSTTFNAALAASFLDMGELAEKPFKMDSKVNTFKTRSGAHSGRRTTTISLTLSGLNCHQKNYLENHLFARREHTILFVDEDQTQAVYIVGCRWSVAWQAESDNNFTATLTTEFSGLSKNKVLMYPELLGMNI